MGQLNDTLETHNRTWNLLTSKLRKTPKLQERGIKLFRCDKFRHKCNECLRNHTGDGCEQSYLQLSPPLKERFLRNRSEIDYLRRIQHEAYEAALHSRYVKENNIKLLKRSGAIKRKANYDMCYRDEDQRIIWARANASELRLTKGQGKAVETPGHLDLAIAPYSYDGSDDSERSDARERRMIKGKGKAVETRGKLDREIAPGSDDESDKSYDTDGEELRFIVKGH